MFDRERNFSLTVSIVFNFQDINIKPSQIGLVVYSIVLAVCSMNGHGFKPQTSINACRHICRCVDWKGSWIKKAWLPCWSLYSRRWISEIHCTQVTKHALSWIFRCSLPVKYFTYSTRITAIFVQGHERNQGEGARNAVPWVQILSFSLSFRETIWPNNRLTSQPSGLAPTTSPSLSGKTRICLWNNVSVCSDSISCCLLFTFTKDFKFDILIYSRNFQRQLSFPIFPNFSAKSWQNSGSIDIQWLRPILCQCRQDLAENYEI